MKQPRRSSARAMAGRSKAAAMNTYDTNQLLPCPFCGAGETQIRENGRIWNGVTYTKPTSVSVLHWCERPEGQPFCTLEKIGRDRESAIAAWNRRVAPTPPAQVEPSDEEIDAIAASMPDGAGGMLKQWGYRQFARALLARYGQSAADEIEGLRAHVALLKSALAQSERENDELRAQPAAITVPAGEREAFEAWVRVHRPYESLRRKFKTDPYVPGVQCYWEAWQARAALAAQAAPAVAAISDDALDVVDKALVRAWNLGQTYWQQANSEYVSLWKRSDATYESYQRLRDDTRAALTTQGESHVD